VRQFVQASDSTLNFTHRIRQRSLEICILLDFLSDTDKNDNCSPFSPSAPGNSLPETRFAYSISFVADGVNLLQGEGHIRYPDNEDFQSYALWIDDIGWGGVADHPLIPVVYQNDSVDEDDI
jgi:hypothetical protein